MLIATVPYVEKRLHLDPDPKLNYGSGSEHANNFRSGSTTLVVRNEVLHLGPLDHYPQKTNAGTKH